MGRLAEEADAASGRRTVTRTETDGARDYTVQVTGTAVAVGTYREERRADGSRRRTVTAPSGLATVRPTAVDGVQTRTTPDGTVTTRTPAPDPRFGLVAATAAVTTRLPSGLAPTTYAYNPAGLLATVTAGTGPDARVTTFTYDAARRLMTKAPLGGEQHRAQPNGPRQRRDQTQSVDRGRRRADRARDRRRQSQ